MKINFLNVEIYNSSQFPLFRISSIASFRKTLAIELVKTIFGNRNILFAKEYNPTIVLLYSTENINGMNC